MDTTLHFSLDAQERSLRKLRRVLALLPDPPQGQTEVVADSSKIAVTRVEAAARLSMSLDTFERHVQPHLKLIRPGEGKLVLIAVSELEAWTRNAGERTIP